MLSGGPWKERTVRLVRGYVDRAHEHTHHVWNLVRSSSFSPWQSFGKVKGGSDGECDGNSVENSGKTGYGLRFVPGRDREGCGMSGREARCSFGGRKRNRSWRGVPAWWKASGACTMSRLAGCGGCFAPEKLFGAGKEWASCFRDWSGVLSAREGSIGIDWAGYFPRTFGEWGRSTRLVKAASCGLILCRLRLWCSEQVSWLASASEGECRCARATLSGQEAVCNRLGGSAMAEERVVFGMGLLWWSGVERGLGFRC
jgi:hypothetical protein